MTQQNKQQMYFGGVPTDPDVRKLRERYPEHSLQAGQEMPYSEVEQIINEKKGTSRFVTVTNRWRNIVQRETGHVIDPNPDELGKSFLVLSESQKLDKAQGRQQRAGRQMRRSAMLSSNIDPRGLTDEEKQCKLHMDHVYARIQETWRLAARYENPSLTE